MSGVVIYHNPRCSTSRNVLALIREAGVEPTVVEYLQTGWSEAKLTELLARMGMTPGEAMRVRDTPAEALGLNQAGVADGAILTAMVAHPELVQRPIVVTPKGAALCRPPERVLDLL
jgi:arsenate reductase (glutaredoxin)